MIKKFFIFFSLLLLAAGPYFYWQYATKKTLLIPYPYDFNSNVYTSLKKELPLAENAKILIVGDRMGEALNKFTPELSAELAKSFKNPPQIYNWSSPHEGLHRTLFKLKSLKKFPSIIIYHGASSELFEQTFAVVDYAAIFKNFSLYDDEKMISLIITFPLLSKIIYEKMHYFELGHIKEYRNQLPSTQKIKEKEISFKLFEYEIRELIDLVKDKKSNLVFITTPLNLEVRPHETCAHSSTDTVIQMQAAIVDLLKDGNYKLAYPKALDLSHETYSNAQSFYLLGQSSLGLGNLSMARASFLKASVFDCANWRGNAVYNSIMKSYAQKRQIPLIDFDQLMASSLSKEGLFMDELFPQNLFYELMIVELKENLKKLLSIE